MGERLKDEATDFFISVLSAFGISAQKLDSETTHLLVKEILNSHYRTANIQIEPRPYSNLSIHGFDWLSQIQGSINENLDKEEKIEFLNLLDSSLCFLKGQNVNSQLYLCDSSAVSIESLQKKEYKTSTSFTWRPDLINQIRKNPRLWSLLFRSQ